MSGFIKASSYFVVKESFSDIIIVGNQLVCFIINFFAGTNKIENDGCKQVIWLSIQVCVELLKFGNICVLRLVLGLSRSSFYKSGLKDLFGERSCSFCKSS